MRRGFDAELLYFSQESVAADIEQLGGAGAIETGFGENLNQQLTFMLSQRRAIAAFRSRACRGWGFVGRGGVEHGRLRHGRLGRIRGTTPETFELGEVDRVALRKNGRLLDEIFELPHIAGPLTVGQPGECRRRNLHGRKTPLPPQLAEEMLGQCGNIFAPLRERGHTDFDDLESIVKILAEAARSYLGGQITIGGGNEPRVYPVRAGRNRAG